MLKEMDKCPFCWYDKTKIVSKRKKTSAGGYYTTKYVYCPRCHARGPVVSTATRNEKVSIANTFDDEQWDNATIIVWNDQSGWLK